MDSKEAAAAINGNEYREEGSRALWASMKDAGLVAVFGASDDLMEFRGAIDEEIGAYNGTTAYITRGGLFLNECEDDDCPYAKKAVKAATPIDAIWARDDISWQFDTAIPHESFDVMEDGEVFCRGIVFALADVPCSKETPA
jgi:hypothetical protein